MIITKKYMPYLRGGDVVIKSRVNIDRVVWAQSRKGLLNRAQFWEYGLGRKMIIHHPSNWFFTGEPEMFHCGTIGTWQFGTSFNSDEVTPTLWTEIKIMWRMMTNDAMSKYRYDKYKDR